MEYVLHEVKRQDRRHPAGYPSTRDGVRMGLATLQDELDEALGAWREERSEEGWQHSYEEVVQVVAVGLRLLHSIIAAGDADPSEHHAICMQCRADLDDRDEIECPHCGGDLQ